ncbi:MAG: penicillin-binding transpeptidase domain-containing protein, partial [Planctomycetota bacterium]|nr:penicillin-binding transpeptidase domain-containing protein [Planctomycetota bacterium]
MRRRQRTRVPRTVPPGQLRRTLEAIRRLRTNFVFGTLMVLFLVLMGRLAKLQIVDADHYRAMADRRHLARYEFAAQRGRILDRFGRVLAQSRPLRRVAIDPHPDVIKDPEAFSLLVSRLLEGSPSATYIRQRIEAERARAAQGKTMKRYIRIGRAIEDPLVIDRLDTVRAMTNYEKDKRRVYGLIVERGEVREYPNDRHAYHVLGKQPPEGEPRGGFGVEAHFNGHLSGRNQKVKALRDRRGRLLALAGAEPGVAYRGGDLTLTLDVVVQHELEEALDEVLREWQPSELCGLVMDPHTGEILAWANRPTHNANLDGEDGLGTFHGGYDYVAAGRYEVGSVFKPITVAWALDKGVVRADEIIPMPEAH